MRTLRARWAGALAVVAAVLAVPAAVPAVALAPSVATGTPVARAAAGAAAAPATPATPQGAAPAALAPPGAAVTAIVASTPAAAALRRDVRIGIGDQKPDMFSDPRFVALGVKHARLTISWDAMTVPWEVQQLDTWLADARADGIAPLISLGHSRTDRRSLPTPERLEYEFLRMRQRYPWVTTWATWNEANHCGEPTCHRPKLVAAYYRALRRGCPKCTILAPEVLDMPNMSSWVKQFCAGLGFKPKLWGVHNYVEANRFKMTRLRALLRVLPRSDIWLTETGGLVRRDNDSTTTIPQGARHAGEVTRYIFDRVVPDNPQIKAVYLYNWNAGPADDSWDSGLITPAGRERTALDVLRRVLRVGPRPHASFRSPRKAR
ncbi:MAG TPA: hypothetical protein VHZ31_08265 [Solirubrobacteraceae bacterium]|nr:hypothetical protein [Solirubrobacteraceae bacterium]